MCNDTGSTPRSRDVIKGGTWTVRDLEFAKSLLVDSERRVIYCAVPKVASSSVKMAMALQTTRVDRTRPVDVHDASFMARLGLASLYRRLATADSGTWHQLVEKVHERMRRFVVVRHPLHRVVSAYRDKFERVNRWNDYFHKRYGKLIVFRCFVSVHVC